jgi:hypothetical protein
MLISEKSVWRSLVEEVRRCGYSRVFVESQFGGIQVLRQLIAGLNGVTTLRTIEGLRLVRR